jgi:hypothetical protein
MTETLNLAAEEETSQHEEKLEGAGFEPTQEEVAKDSLSEEIVEQQLSDGPTELDSVTEWKFEATEEEELQPSVLHK